MKNKRLLCVGCVLLMGGLSMWAQSHFYYQPPIGFCGDPMPFYDDHSSTFRVYYLQEYRPNELYTFHPVYALETNDLVHYAELGEVLPHGTTGDTDAAIGTGSVIRNHKDNTYYFFYTGNSASGKQCVQYATSPDGLHWTKQDFCLNPSSYMYGEYDFRDPEVIWGDDNKFHMFVSTKKGDKGVIAEFTSSNLTFWTHQGVFMNMLWDRFYECPNVFKIGDWWYLVYSEMHKEIRRVQYFKASSLTGLKSCTENDTPHWPDDHEGYLDSRAFYAGKTASDGTNRYIWGWCPTRRDENNLAINNENGEPDWAGTLVAHRLIQQLDGSLTVEPVQSIGGYFNKEVELDRTGANLTAGNYLLLPAIEQQNHLSFTVTTGGASDNFGISVLRDAETTCFYSLVVNSESGAKRKVNFEQEGGTGFIPYADGALFTTPADNTYHVDVYIDRSVLVMYINGIYCYTNRIYGMQTHRWSINCYSGTIQINNMRQEIFSSEIPVPKTQLFPNGYAMEEKVLGYKGAECLFIGKDKLVDAEPGNIIRVYGRLTGEAPHELTAGEWAEDDVIVSQHLPGSIFKVVDHLPSEIFLTPDMLKAIREENKDFRLYGKNITVTKVELIQPGKAVLPEIGKLLWTGYFWMDSWSTMDLFLDGLNIDWSLYKEMVIYHDANRLDYAVNILSQFDKEGAKVPDKAVTKNDCSVVIDLTAVNMTNIIQAADEAYRQTLKIQMNKETGSPFNITDIVLVPKSGPATDVEHAAEDTPKLQKKLVNGQLVIIKNGIKYNAMGVRL